MIIQYGTCQYLTVKILPDFTPEFNLALKWSQLANGDWFAVDRTSAADYYASTINFYGQESVINNLISKLESNRTSGSNVITLSSFSATEHIFGSDVDYSGLINATVDYIGQPRRSQNTWEGWGLTLRIVALSPLFQSVVPSLPVFKLIKIGVDADSDHTILKSPTYTNSFTYTDHSSDYGTFVGNFLFTDGEMAKFRRFMATNRALHVTIPKLYGITYPFGRRSSANPTNFPVYITKWEDEKMYDITRWNLKLTMVEAFS